MSKIRWNYKNISAFSDSTGFIEEFQGTKQYMVEFNWSVSGWDSHRERINVDIELEPINVYDTSDDTYDTIEVTEYEEQLTELIEDYINNNTYLFGVDNEEDLKNYLTNYE